MADEKPPTPQYIHLLRTTQTIHVSLSQMADQKASILMGATFVIFTIAISQGHGSMPPLPLAILGGFAFLSAVLAMSAVMPVWGTSRGRRRVRSISCSLARSPASTRPTISSGCARRSGPTTASSS